MAARTAVNPPATEVVPVTLVVGEEEFLVDRAVRIAVTERTFEITFLDAGAQAVKAIQGDVASVHVIARPHPDVEAVLPKKPVAK
jgi:hypothetical protein